MLDLIHGECSIHPSPQGPWVRRASGFCPILLPVVASWAWLGWDTLPTGCWVSPYA